ncbi:MAG: hypothetical protein AWU57_16 [Marinobacter sp. T13-3]|nr:MAG: hypothetical protein AWU57_16 [Marinobacter sp. T13-3]
MAVDFDKISLRLQVKRVVDALPQRKMIADETAERWIDGIIKRDPERAVWHAKRAGGLGGSEIGELVAVAAGLPTTYSTLEEISRQKLLLDFPMRENEHMARGTAMEPLAQKVYWKTSGDTSVLDDPDVAKAFEEGHPEHEWLVGNPDEVAECRRVGRVITDFKVRNNLDPEDGAKLVNVCQLHWYGVLYEGHFKEPPAGYKLGELDIPTQMIDSLMAEDNPDFDALAETIASVNRPGFGIQTRFMPHNPNLAAHMVRLGEQFWNTYVMTGTPYQSPRPSKPENLTKEDDATMREALNEFIRFKIAEGVSKQASTDYRQKAIEIGEKYELKEWPFEVPGLSAGYKKMFNANRAANYLIAKQGVSRADLQKPSDTLDTDAAMQVLKNNGLLDDSLFKPSWDTKSVKAALKQHGISATEFEEQTFRAGVSTKKADQPQRQQLEDAIKDHIAGWGKQQPADKADLTQPDAPDNLGDALNDMEDDLNSIRLG